MIYDPSYSYGVEVLEVPDCATEPVSLEEVKDHLSIEADNIRLDSSLKGNIVAARELAERYTRRQIVDRVLRLSLTWLPERIELPGGKVREVNAFEYLNVSEVWAAVDAGTYEELLQFEPSRLIRKRTGSWPNLSAISIVRARVDYQAGWETADEVPGPIKQAMLLTVGNWHYQRGDDHKVDLPAAAKCLLDAWQMPLYG